MMLFRGKGPCGYKNISPKREQTRWYSVCVCPYVWKCASAILFQ